MMTLRYDFCFPVNLEKDVKQKTRIDKRYPRLFYVSKIDRAKALQSKEKFLKKTSYRYSINNNLIAFKTDF